jgi:hypothetical protein
MELFLKSLELTPDAGVASAGLEVLAIRLLAPPGHSRLDP